MKTDKLSIESVSIWCPGCGEFIAGPFSGSSLLDPEEYSKLPYIITCSSCGDEFKKPAVSSFNIREMRSTAAFK